MTDQTIITSRADLRVILQRAGIARAAADLVAKSGWAALSNPDQSNAEKDDLNMSIQDLRLQRGEKAAALKSLVAKPNWKAAIDQPKYDAIMGDINAIDVDIRRYQDANEAIAAAATGFGAGGYGGDSSEHLTAFTNVLRNPKDMRGRAALSDIQNVSTGATDPAGGFAIPDIILGPLMARATNANPFRELVRTVNVGTRDVSFPLSNSNSTTGWIGEGATRTATVEATLANAKPTFGSLYSYVEATEELVMDSFFDIGSWFAFEAGNAMGEAEMASIISGSGVDRPSGLLLTPPTNGADGTRAATVLKYLATGNASTLGAAPGDLLISLVYDLKASYRTGASWVMNSAVAGQIRQLKDASGRYLWLEGIAQGEPATLLGYPVRIAKAMAGVTANAHPILFGDFSRAYVACDLGGLRVTVDDNVTVPGRIKWYIRRRMGGIVYDCNAVRAIKVAVS